MRVTVLIPVFNERWTLRELVRRVYEQSGLLHEVVVVDDGSTDGSAARLKELEGRYAAHRAPLRAVYKSVNEGKGAAIKAGLSRVSGDVVLIQDADLEYNPRDYAALLAPLSDGRADVVYGSRFSGGSAQRVLFFWHAVANRLLTLCCNLFSDLNLSDVWTCYKLIPVEMLRRLDLRSSGFGFEPEVTIKLSRLGCRIYEVPISYEGRTYEEGKKIGFRDAVTGTLAMIRAWLSFHEAPGPAADAVARDPGALREQLEPYLGREVIEFRAGSGKVSRLLLDRDRLVLTDPDPHAVAALERIYRDWGYIQVMVLDPARPEVAARPRGSFDSAVCAQAPEAGMDEAAVLRNMGRLLKPEGRLLLVLHDRGETAVRETFHAADLEVEALRGFGQGRLILAVGRKKA